METVKLIALRPHYYDRDLKAGESYEAKPDHAAILERSGASRRAEPTEDKPRQYKRRDMVAEQ